MYFLFLFFFFFFAKGQNLDFQAVIMGIVGTKKNKNAPLDNQSLLTGLCAVNQ